MALRAGRALPLVATLMLLTAATAIADEFDTALESYANSGRFRLPQLNAEDRERLLAGEPLVFDLRDDSEGNDTSTMAILGAKVYEVPRTLVWLTALGGNRDYRAARDDGDKAAGKRQKSRVVHAMLERWDDGSYIRYQHIRLPWPVRDRHWAILCQKNTRIAEASNGQVWEHYWQLDREGRDRALDALESGELEGLSRKQLERAIYLPANQGAWIMVDLGGDRTLVLAYMDVALGGSFPRAIVRRFTETQLKKGLDALAELAARVHEEYDEQPYIHDGFGEPVSIDDARQTARRWQAPRDVAIAHP